MVALSQTSVDASNRSTANETLASIPTGTASADRTNVIIVPNPANTITAATLNGLPATFTFDPTNSFYTIVAPNPTGTTATLVLTGLVAGFQTIGVWAITGGPVKNLAPSASAYDTSGAGAPSVAVTDGGVVIGVAADGASAVTTPSWATGLTNQGSAFTINGGSNSARDAGANFASAQTVTTSITGCTFPVGFVAAFSLGDTFANTCSLNFI